MSNWMLCFGLARFARLAKARMILTKCGFLGLRKETMLVYPAPGAEVQLLKVGLALAGALILGMGLYSRLSELVWNINHA